MLFADVTTGFPLNWTVLVPVVLGFASIWLMLPTPRRKPIVWPIVTGLSALIGVVLYLTQSLGEGTVEPVEQVVFYCFSLQAILFAGLMITQRNPARAALCFVMVILGVCGLFLLLAAPFLMAATIIIYAGAIIVTFLFVLMLSQQHGMSNADDRSREPFLAALVGCVFLGSLLVGLQRVYSDRGIDTPISMCQNFAEANALDENLKNPGFVESFLDRIESVKDRLATATPSAVLGEKKVLGKSEAVVKIEMAVVNLRNELSGKPDLMLVKTHCKEIAHELNYLKAVREGTLNPNEDVLLSPNGASRVVVGDRNTEVAQNRLPAANVAALGRALFSDHLLAIELGGTLLLVATIGTIAIAGTRRERVVK